MVAAAAAQVSNTATSYRLRSDLGVWHLARAGRL